MKTANNVHAVPMPPIAHQLSEHERLAVHSLPIAVHTCDMEGHIMFYNSEAVNLWGHAPEAGKDKWCGAWRVFLTDGTALSPEHTPAAETLRTLTPVRGQEVIIVRADGTRRNVLVHTDVLHDDAGVPCGIVSMLYDITERAEALAQLSHDLRTPLNAISGVGHILKKLEPKSEQQQKCIDMLNISVGTLTGIIDKIGK